MNSVRETPKNPELALLSNEIGFIRKKIQEAISELDVAKVSSWLQFFNTLHMVQLQSNEFLRDSVLSEWNIMLENQKQECLPKIRANAVQYPKIQEKHLIAQKKFLNFLSQKKLLDESSTVMGEVLKKIEDILTSWK
jgi:hypothetical protein